VRGESRGVPGRSPYEIALSDEERAELRHLAACYTRPHREVLRAKLVLMAAEGKTNTEIGEQLGMSRESVGRWRKRFCEEGLDGLKDKARPGRPRRFPPGRGHPGQGHRLRVAQRTRRPALALQPG
jgi:DNA-binding CsgD family transcriptional regulator